MAVIKESEIPELKTLIKKLLIEVKNLKAFSYKPLENQGDDFINNEINERNNSLCNLIFYNTAKCESNLSDERIEFDLIQVNNIIKSILVYCNILIQIKVIRLGRYQKIKLRSIKATFSTTSDVSEILKN